MNGKKLFVDKVTEESFYVNLLLGLPNLLDKLPNVYEKDMKYNAPATKWQIRKWENSNGVELPSDVQDFYSSSNGLSFTYTFSYESMNRENPVVNSLKAEIKINSIDSLILMEEYDNKSMYNDMSHKLNFGADSKLFVLSDERYYKVVLVYEDLNHSSLWVFWKNYYFFIADDLTTYLRKAIAHLAVPEWQFIFSPLGLPEQSREMLNIIAPGILNRSVVPDQHIKINKINPNIFSTSINEDKSKNNNQTFRKQKIASNPLGRYSSATTIKSRTSCMKIDEIASSIVASYSEEFKKMSSQHYPLKSCKRTKCL